MRRSSFIILLFLTFAFFLNYLFPGVARAAVSLPEGWTVSSSNAQWGAGWGENNGEALIVDAPLKTNEKAMELIGHHVSGTSSRFGINHKIPGLELDKTYAVTTEVFVPSDSNSQMVEVLVTGWNADYSKQFQVVDGNKLKINTTLKNQWQTVSADFSFTDAAVDFSKVDVTLAVWNDQKAIYKSVKIEERKTISKGSFNGHGSGLPASLATIDGKQAILFGEVAARQNPYPVGYVSAARTFTPTLENHTLSFSYNIFSYDIIYNIEADGTEKYYDSFEVAINLPADQIPDTVRDAVGCKDKAKTNPDLKVFQPSSSGLIFCAGRDRENGLANGMDTLWVSGWRSVTLDFTNFINQKVTIYATQWSREWDSDFWNDNAHFNMYSYIYASGDEITGIFAYDFSPASCPRGDLGNLNCDSDGLINTMDFSMLFSSGTADAQKLSKMLINWGQ